MVWVCCVRNSQRRSFHSEDSYCPKGDPENNVTESNETNSVATLHGELDRYGHTEIRLSGMSSEEIKDFAKLRYRMAINDSIAEFLSMNIGDPLCLVSCFNLLQKRGYKLPFRLSDVEEILPEAIDPVRCIYSELDDSWKDRVDCLCILHPPLPLSLIACMLKTKEKRMARLQDELDQSIVFRKLARIAHRRALRGAGERDCSNRRGV